MGFCQPPGDGQPQPTAPLPVEGHEPSKGDFRHAGRQTGPVVGDRDLEVGPDVQYLDDNPASSVAVGVVEQIDERFGEGVGIAHRVAVSTPGCPPLEMRPDGGGPFDFAPDQLIHVGRPEWQWLVLIDTGELQERVDEPAGPIGFAREADEEDVALGLVVGSGSTQRAGQVERMPASGVRS